MDSSPSNNDNSVSNEINNNARTSPEVVVVAGQASGAAARVNYEDQVPEKVLRFGHDLYIFRQLKVAKGAGEGGSDKVLDLVNIRKTFGYNNKGIDVNFSMAALPDFYEAVKQLERERRERVGEEPLPTE